MSNHGPGLLSRLLRNILGMVQICQRWEMFLLWQNLICVFFSELMWYVVISRYWATLTNPVDTVINVDGHLGCFFVWHYKYKETFVLKSFRKTIFGRVTKTYCPLAFVYVHLFSILTHFWITENKRLREIKMKNSLYHFLNLKHLQRGPNAYFTVCVRLVAVWNPVFNIHFPELHLLVILLLSPPNVVQKTSVWIRNIPLTSCSRGNQCYALCSNFPP